METLENFYVRVVSPPLVALVVGTGTAIFLASFYPPLAAVLIGFFLGLGFLLPLSSLLLGREPGKALITLRADLNIRLVDGIQGLPDILAYGRADDMLTQIAITGQEYGQAQKRMARISGFHSGLATLLTNLGLWLVVYLTIPQVTNGYIPGPDVGRVGLADTGILRSCHSPARLPRRCGKVCRLQQEGYLRLWMRNLRLKRMESRE